MAYDIVICAAEDFTAESKEEKALTFEAEHSCLDCTKVIRNAIAGLMKFHKGRRTK
jgi:hypothetical protein